MALLTRWCFSAPIPTKAIRTDLSDGSQQTRRRMQEVKA
jgi:hypothetical protein